MVICWEAREVHHLSSKLHHSLAFKDYGFKSIALRLYIEEKGTLERGLEIYKIIFSLNRFPL